MEIVEDNYNSEYNYHNNSTSLIEQSLMTCDNMSSIYELSDQTCDENLSKSFGNCNLINGTLDNVSDKTSSSLETDFEALLHDYSKIVNCLSTECCQRSDTEIALLSQLLESIPEFMNRNSNELEILSQYARLVVIETINSPIVTKYSGLDYWYFCLSGSLRKEDSDYRILTPGDFIGADLGSSDVLISDFNLYSNSDNVNLMVIGRDDLNPSKRFSELIIKTNDEDKTVIAVYEVSLYNSDSTDNVCYVLSKGTPEILMNNLLTNSKNVHRDFAEDFFMTHRLYHIPITSIMDEISNALFEDFNEAKDKFFVLLRWLSQNFYEFEADENKMKFIRTIASILTNQKHQDWLYLLYDLCSSHASIRRVKRKLSFVNNIVECNRDNDRTLFFIHNINDGDELLKNGDVIIQMEEYSQEFISRELMETLCDDQKAVSFLVRTDLLGYHEYILKDVSIDTCSLHSTPSNSTFSRCSSDKVSDSVSVSTVDSDFCNTSGVDSSPSMKKRPSLIPNFFSSLQSGTVGRFFKNPKHYSNLLKRKYSKTKPITIIPNNGSISDVSNGINLGFERPNYMTASSVSIQRISRRLKHQRKSATSNPEIIKSFDEREITESDSFQWSSNQANYFPIRIYWKEIFLGRSENNGNPSKKSDLHCIHFMIKPTTPVSEVVILALLKLEVSSASSNHFYLVEVKVDESNVMIHEKILKPTLSNLRLKVHSRFYLKHKSFVGNSLILQKEAERMIEEFQSLSLMKLSINELVIRLFLKSHKLICNLHPDDLISYVTGHKATLKINKHHTQSDNDFNNYILLSDFYKNWVITEICSEQMCSLKRAGIIHYFIWLANKALYVGHIDLFFSLMSGLDSTEITRLTSSWDKVSSQDKKLFTKLKSTLNVSGNMRNLRSLHQKMSSPFIPVTAVVIKDLTMIEETNPTFVEGTINGLQANKNLVNFDKMRKMAQLSRVFINSICTCSKDKLKPVAKHLSTCSSRFENEGRLESLLFQKMEADSHPPFINYSISFDQKFDRKHSNSTLSMKSSSSESLSDTTPKSNQDHMIYQAFEQQRMNKKIDLYLSKLESMVISDGNHLSAMSVACESSSGYQQNTLKSKSAKNIKIQDDLIFNHKHFESNAPPIDNISGKAAEILGLKAKSTIHKFKKSNGS